MPVETGASTFDPGNPTTLLKTRYYSGFAPVPLELRGYDVSADGRRFLMIKDMPSEQTSTATSPTLVVVLHWCDELKARVPTR